MVQVQDRSRAFRGQLDGEAHEDLAPKACRYRAFISYSHENEPVAKWLHKALETWRPPRHLLGRQTAVGPVPKSLAPVFRDRDELPSSANLNQQVDEALQQSANLIVICSPAAAHSRWVNEEVKAFQRLGRADRVLCLIVRGEPNAASLPSNNDADCFVPALRHPSGPGRLDTGATGEPIAADIRPGQDGKRLALLKLISGMLGLRLDELRMREHQRRVRRLSLITAGAVLIMLVTTTMAIMALMARQSAERQQSQAEGLVGFMLNDLGEKMQDNTRLVTLQAVNDRAMAYYASLPRRDVNDKVMSGRADALKSIGIVRFDQGRLKQAQASFEAAEKITADLLAHKPGNLKRMVAQAKSLTWLGYAFWYQGSLDEALTEFHRAESMLAQADAHTGTDSEIAHRLGTVRTNIGRILERRGDLPAAESQFQAVLQTFKKLHARNPSNNLWYSELGFAYNNLGKLAWQQGRLVGAVAYYQADLDIKSRLAASNPGKRQWQSDLALTRAMLGSALVGTGNLKIAETDYRQAVDAGRANVDFDHDNVTSQDIYATYSMLLGRALRIQGKLPQAQVHSDEARRILAKLASKHPDNVVYRQDLASVLLENARLQAALGDQTTAMQYADRATNIAHALLRENPADNKLRMLTAEALLAKARRLAADNKRQSAAAALHEARALIEPVGQSSSNPDYLNPWAIVLLMLGDKKAAYEVVSRLDKMGYRNPDFMQFVARHGGAARASPLGKAPATASGHN
ncbi:MAG: toll/interleukin-1 receptor domain-containing protein [Rhodanobacteraceae bacterium]